MARWITLCAVAEAIGMTAAATAAKASRALVGEPGNPREASLTLTLVVAGGLIEGLAPEAEWSVPAVVALGTATGLVAGAVLGLVSWWFLDTLDGPAAYNLFVLRLLGICSPGAGPVAGRAPRPWHGDGAGLRAPGAVCRRRRLRGDPARQTGGQALVAQPG